MKGKAIQNWSRGPNGYDLYIGDFDSSNYMACKIHFEYELVTKKDVRTEANHPVTHIGEDDYQALKGLTECLKQMGLLELKTDATKAELDATKRHLEDMRALRWSERKPK